MAVIEIIYDVKPPAWIIGNTNVPKNGEPVYLTNGQYALGDGVTQVQALTFYGGAGIAGAGTPNELAYFTGAATIASLTTATYPSLTELSYVKGITSSVQSQINAKYDASNPAGYITAAALAPYLTIAAAAATYQPLGSYALTTNPLSQFASTTSAQLAGVISDETGSGALVFGTSPTFTTEITTPRINGTNGSLLITDSVQSSGAVTNLTITPPNHTGQTASINIPLLKINGANITRNSGTISLQYFNQIGGNTLTISGGGTATNVYGLFVNRSVEGASTIFSNNYAIGADGNIQARSAVNTIISSETSTSTAIGSFYAIDDLGNSARMTCYGSAFSVTHLRSDGVLLATNDLHLIPSLGSSSGGSGELYLYSGGYNTTQQRVHITSAGSINCKSRLQKQQGADVASANNLALGADGNSFEITGTTQINLISNTNWQNGAEITLLFTSTPTVKHNQATSGSNITIQLSGAVDFVATAGDTLTLLLSEIGGTQAWREISRAII